MKYQALRPHFFSVGGLLEGSSVIYHNITSPVINIYFTLFA